MIDRFRKHLLGVVLSVRTGRVWQRTYHWKCRQRKCVCLRWRWVLSDRTTRICHYLLALHWSWKSMVGWFGRTVPLVLCVDRESQTNACLCSSRADYLLSQSVVSDRDRRQVSIGMTNKQTSVNQIINH